MGLNVSDLHEFIGDDMLPIEIEPLSDDAFLVVKETLTRIGFTQVRDDSKVLYQTCHILHKKGRYFITHFKHMYLFDGKIQHTNILDVDINRLKYVVKLLMDWNLITPLDKSSIAGDVAEVRVLKHNEAREWTLKPKYFNSFKTDYMG